MECATSAAQNRLLLVKFRGAQKNLYDEKPAGVLRTSFWERKNADMEHDL
jgi:hypothetical protein